MKKLALITAISGITLLIAETVTRVAGIKPAYGDKVNNLMSVRPNTFFTIDSILGWRLGTGGYGHYYNDSLFCSYTINRLGNRITSNDSLKGDSLIQMHIYGCSHSFGFSVPDSCSLPWYLQQKLAGRGWQVHNKAVPGYGLVQMFLSLQREVASGRKPDLALFNYSCGHDNRTGLSRNWCEGISFCVFQMRKAENKNMRFPYAIPDGDSVKIISEKLDVLPNDFPLRTVSAFVNLINTSYSNMADKNHESLFRSISVKTALSIARYCKRQDIMLVFTGLSPCTVPLLDSLQKAGVYTLVFETDKSKVGYNCAPLDPAHPNALANRMYTGELMRFFEQKEILEKLKAKRKYNFNR